MKVKTYRPQRRKQSFLSLIQSWSWQQKIGGFFCLSIFFIFLYAWLVLPSVGNASQLMFAESTIIYDRGALDPKNDPNDHILYVIHGDENREFVPLEEISPWIRKSTIAIEDDSFYSWYHWGFDIGGTIKGTLNYFFGIGSRRGGSTITQQLVKNTFLSRERTVTRKFNEILLSIKMELAYSKDEILEMYLNKIPYGHNAHGIEAAAKTFFGKSARDLTLAESSILASLPVAPTRFSPYGTNKRLLMGWQECDGQVVSADESEDTETEKKSADFSENCTYKKGRKDLVLQRLLETGEISETELKNARIKAAQTNFTQNRTDIKAPHFVFYVRQQLEEKYGKEFLRDGGLRIYTTLDPELQKIAEDTIAIKTPHYANTYSANNVAMTSINPDNGEILAYVGGKDYFDEENDGQFDVMLSRRQPGSSFKPLTYATAFENGYSPSTLLFDVETDFGGNYKPQNFDGSFIGPVTARESLNRSLNIPAVKMAYLATPKKIFENVAKVGTKIEGTPDQHGVALGIGVGEIEPLSHINSFQTFARDGSYYEPTAILEIQNSNGRTLEIFDPSKTKKEGIDPQIAGLVRDILTDEKTRPTTNGFDWNQLLQLGEYDNGAKTGTSNRRVENPDFDEEKPEDEEENPREITAPGDSWTIGFTPQLVTGVWVGNNDGAAMKPGATGMTVAAPVWKKFMLDAHEVLKAQFLEKNPELTAKDFEERLYPYVGLEERKINKYTGKVATEKTAAKYAVDEVFPSFSAPIELDDFADLTTEQKKKIFQSVRPDLANWQNPVESWLEENPDFFRSIGVQVSSFDSYYTDKNYQSLWREYQKQWQQKNTNKKNDKAFQIFSPKRNQKITINSLFQAIVTIHGDENEIEKVRFFINKTAVGQVNKAPYEINISTKGKLPGKAEFIVQVWKKDGTVSEQTVPITLEREKILQNQNPLFGAFSYDPDAVHGQVVSGAKKKIDSIRIVGEQRGKAFYERVYENPPKILQFSILKTTRGLVDMEIYTKFEGEEEKRTSTKQIRF